MADLSGHGNLRPMGLGLSLLYFGIPALLTFLGFHGLMLILVQVGVAPFYAYALGVGIPILGLFFFSFWMARREGVPLTWVGIKKRFRLKPMDQTQWVWTILAYVTMFLGYGVVGLVTNNLIQQGIIPTPNFLPPFLDPTAAIPPGSALEQAFFGLRGNWLGLGAYLLLLVINVFGEEFWWRGVILPRQELVFGANTWWIHGLFWTAFHAFKWWDLINLLPVTLIFSFIVWRMRNNTPGIILHFAFNGVGVIPIFLAVIGRL